MSATVASCDFSVESPDKDSLGLIRLRFSMSKSLDLADMHPNSQDSACWVSRLLRLTGSREYPRFLEGRRQLGGVRTVSAM